MKFIYEYRTSDNVRHEGVICAVSREAAFVTLKSRGIRPGRVDVAPGFINLLWGKGKRWCLIAILAAVVSGLSALVLRQHRQIEVISELAEDVALFQERCQIYGDEGILRDAFQIGWAHVFSNRVDQLLAAYAVPGRALPSTRFTSEIEEQMIGSYVRVEEGDFAEVATMKRIVNGMKRELLNYLKSGGNISSYIDRLESRQQEEIRIFNRVKTQLRFQPKESAEWRERNADLRAMGLPMISPFEDE